MRPCRFSPHFTHGPAAFGPAVLHTALPLSGPFVLLPVRALPSCPAGRHFSQKEMADKAPGQSRLSFGVGGVSVRAASANNERSKKRKAAPTADQRAKGENSQGNKRGTKAAGSNVKGVKKITVPQEASGKCVRAAFPAPTVGPTFVLRALAAFSVSMLATLRVASACAFALGWQRRARVHRWAADAACSLTPCGLRGRGEFGALHTQVPTNSPKCAHRTWRALSNVPLSRHAQAVSVLSSTAALLRTAARAACRRT
jgi:hypothetical protein